MPSNQPLKTAELICAARLVIAAILFAVLATAALAQQSSSSMTSIYGTWRIIEIAGWSKPVPTRAQMTFTPQGKATGRVGCNRIGGNFKIIGNRITFTNLAITLMACDSTQHDIDRLFLAVLGKKRILKYKSGVFSFQDEKGDIVLRLSR